MSSPQPKLDVFALARAAGLTKAVDDFPECVANAARTAAVDLAELPVEDNSTTQPWPPMRVRIQQ